MSASSLLTELLQAQSAVLAFEAGWLAPAASARQDHQWHNWLGQCQPDACHAIELIDHANVTAGLPLLSARLAATTAQQPACVIFCAGLPCPHELHQALRAHDIGIVHTPLAARLVCRGLLAALAEQLPVVQKHGVFMRIHGLGVFITGQSGTGKSSLALELIGRGHALVADDICQFYRMPKTQSISGMCPPLLYDLLHIDELGVLNIAKLFGPASSLAVHELNLVIELVYGHRPNAAQRLQAQPYRFEVLDMAIPQLKIRPRQTENLALLVETAVKNQLLYRDGYDANADLAQRQQHLLNSV